jgi:DNA-binding MarR family transcriptional regulator
MRRVKRQEASFPARVAAVRRFNRFYTRRIGVLNKGMYETPLSLAEVRVLFELSQHENPTATDLRKSLGLDVGYLSRMLRGFERSGVIRRTPSKSDRRRRHLCLTTQGRRALVPINARADAEAGALLKTISKRQQVRLLAAMDTIVKLLGNRDK